MEAVCISETLASTDESRRRQNTEEHHHPHRRENLKYHMIHGRAHKINENIKRSKRVPYSVIHPATLCRRVPVTYLSQDILVTAGYGVSEM
jgi:hypothetical protein